MICATCKKPIEGRSLSAMGNSYHPEHFACDVCGRPIAEATFHQKDGKPICQKDYEASCPPCATCGERILDRQVVAMGKHFHAEHFACKLCKAPIAGGEYRAQAGDPVCSRCFAEKVADRCKACAQPIVGDATVALAAKWHPDCFKCAKCNRAITAKTFGVSGGRPTCGGC